MQKVKELIPHLFTAGNLVGGIIAIILTLTGNIHIAPFFIFASAILDFFDGFVARLLNVQSELGKQLDSLADMVTFGVAPGVIVFVLLLGVETYEFIGDWNHYTYTEYESEITDKIDSSIVRNDELNNGEYVLHNELKICGPRDSGLLIYAAFLIPIFAMFRLAKFNLDSRQSDSFIGLPTPAMTLFFASIPLMMHFVTFESVWWQFPILKFILQPWTLASLSLIFSLLMVANLPLFALKFKNFKWKGNEIRFIFLTLCVILLATLFFWAIPLIIILYLILSVVNNMINKSKANEIQS